MKGKIILIEGTDCSGKQTQAEKLIARMRDAGLQVQLVAFPRYNTTTGRIVGECYLGRDFGHGSKSWFEEADKVDPKIASLYYAADRRNARDEILALLDQGINVILDRYVESNMGHQGGKIKDFEERKKMTDWINELEYGLMELPKPDLVVFLYMPYEASEKLKANRIEVAVDAHETNPDHLKNAENCYLELAERFSWKKVNCAVDDLPRMREDIHEDVWGVVKEVLEDSSDTN
jgi:dTMP kinase